MNDTILLGSHFLCTNVSLVAHVILNLTLVINLEIKMRKVRVLSIIIKQYNLLDFAVVPSYKTAILELCE